MRFPMAVVRQWPLVDADQAKRIERLKITEDINDSAGTEQKSPVGNPAMRKRASYLQDYQRQSCVTIMSTTYLDWERASSVPSMSFQVRCSPESCNVFV